MPPIPPPNFTAPKSPPPTGDADDVAEQDSPAPIPPTPRVDLQGNQRIVNHKMPKTNQLPDPLPAMARPEMSAPPIVPLAPLLPLDELESTEDAEVDWKTRRICIYSH